MQYRARPLAQAGGFQSIPPVEEAAKPDRLAIPEVRDEADRRLDRHPARPAADPHPAARHDAVPEVADVAEADAELFEGMVDLPEEIPNAIVASIDGGLAIQPFDKRRLPFDIGGALLEQRLDVTAVVRRESALEGLGVCLGHGALSI